MSQFRFRQVSGKDIRNVIRELSQIRIQVFKEWPYLYDGSLEYERQYLQNYFDHPRSLCILVSVDEKVVGVSTLMPLEGEHGDLKNPVLEAGYDISKIFYYGESCLLPEYRGSGIYPELFKRRLEHVESFGDEYHKICFCSVIRPDEHPLKPPDYRPLNEFWKRQGFERIPGLEMSYDWKDIGDSAETKKKLAVWMMDVKSYNHQ